MQMPKFSGILTVALVWIFAAPTLRAEEPKPEAAKPRRVWQQLRPERLISEDTFLYVSTPDITKLKAAFERTALNGLLNEDEIRNPIIATFGKLRDSYVKGDNMRNEAEVRRRTDAVNLFTRILPLIDGQAALAIDSQSQQGNKAPKFLFIASMPNEERQRELETMLDKYRFSQTTDPHYRDINDRVGLYDVYKMENNDIGLSESWAFVENLFIYGQGEKIVEDAIERYSSKNGAGTLSLNSGYQGAFREVGRDDKGESLVYMQIDMRGVVKNIPALAGAARDGAQLDATRPHVAVGLQIGDGSNAAIRERILIRLPKDALPGKPPENFRTTTARFAQNDTLYFTATQFNLADAFKSFSAKALGKRDASLDYIKNLVGAANEAEVVSKLEMFKGECALFISYVPQATPRFENMQDVFETFQMVVAVELDRDLNEVVYNNLMKRIEERTKQTYVSSPVKDVTMRYQKGAAPREEKGTTPLGLFGGVGAASQDPTIVPFFLSYARVEVEAEGGGPARKFLLMSDSLNALRKAIQQSRSPKSSLAEDNRFREMQKSLRDSRYDFNFVDLSKMVDIYGVLLPYLGRSGLVSRETLNQMPSPNALRSHIFPMAWGSSLITDPEGIVVETYSPTGNLPLVTLLGLTAWPVIADRQSEAVSREIDWKYKQVMLGLHLYASDFDRFPQQLSDLYPTYVKDKAVFESPFKRGELTEDNINNPDYTNMVYVPGRSLQDKGDDILVYEKEPTRLVKTSDGSQLYHHVVTIDGKKTWLTKPALDLRLAGRVDYVSSLAEKNKPPEKKNAGQQGNNWLDRLFNPGMDAPSTPPPAAPKSETPETKPAPVEVEKPAKPSVDETSKRNLPEHLKQRAP